MKRKCILLTGGLGYIGSHTAVELMAAGFDVVIVDNLSNTRIEVLDALAQLVDRSPVFVKADLSLKQEVDKLFTTYNFDGCIHFAAFKAVGESVVQPLKYYENNLSSLIYLLQNFIKNGGANLIFSSSCTVYGQAEKMPITEDAPVQMAESPYGNTKQICEEIIADTVKSHPEVKVISLRYFNPVGAHQSALIGELPLGVPQNLVPYITQTAAGIREELSVFGHDYPTPDGTAIRDYIHVVDLARAHVLALKKLFDGQIHSNPEILNLGTGKGSSVLEVIQAFELSSGQKLKWKFAPRRAGDVVQAYADCTKAEKVLGWKAQKTLVDAMRDAWNWQLKLADDGRKKSS